MMMMDPGGGSRATAAAAIRSLAAVLARSRSVSPDSMTASELAGTAPPCTRRIRPMRSRAERSRRTVSVVTEELLGQLGHGDAALTGDGLGHGLLAFLGVHRAPSWVGGGMLRWRVVRVRRVGRHSSVSVLFYPRIC